MPISECVIRRRRPGCRGGGGLKYTVWGYAKRAKHADDNGDDGCTAACALARRSGKALGVVGHFPLP